MQLSKFKKLFFLSVCNIFASEIISNEPNDSIPIEQIIPSNTLLCEEEEEEENIPQGTYFTKKKQEVICSLMEKTKLKAIKFAKLLKWIFSILCITIVILTIFVSKYLPVIIEIINDIIIFIYKLIGLDKLYAIICGKISRILQTVDRSYRN